MKIINGFHLKNVRGDILGGITAAVVALPLALAFGNAALGPGGAIYGLYGAVVVGFLLLRIVHKLLRQALKQHYQKQELEVKPQLRL